MYYRKVKAYIEEFEMIREGDQVIAGVSGGGDSMAMLSCLRQYREEMDFSLKVVHVHHGIRGEEADRDAALVKQVCSDWQIPCQILRYDVPDLAKGWKVGTEEAGRRVRQEAFTLASKGCTARVRIALAHNQDDLAETVVHNLCRGTGIRGLSAMRPVSDPIIRPVLCLKKQQILEYLKGAGILYGQDSTNLSEEYTRNRIRHRILPLLQEQINPKASAHMAETAQILAAAGDYLFAQGECLLKQYAGRLFSTGKCIGSLWAFNCFLPGERQTTGFYIFTCEGYTEAGQQTGRPSGTASLWHAGSTYLSRDFSFTWLTA